MADQDAVITLGVDWSALQTGMLEAQAAVRDGVGSMKTAFESVQGAFASFNEALLGVTSAIAGGEMFKDAVQDTVNLGKEVLQMSRTMGISQTTASQLSVALDNVHASSDQAALATQHISMTLRQNEQAFKDLGVQTRDQNGNYRDSLDIMLDTNAALMRFKEGTDRNVEGIKIYGRAWMEVQDIFHLTRAQMNEAKKEAEEFGLTIGTQEAAKIEAYRVAMAHVNTAMEGMKRVIADAVMPVLTSFGSWVKGYGSEIMIGFRLLVMGVADAFRGLVMVFDLVKDGCNALDQLVVAGLMEIWGIAKNLATLDFSGAYAAYKAGGDNINRILAERGAEAQNIVTTTFQNIKKAWSDAWNPPKEKPLPDPGGKKGDNTSNQKALDDAYAATLAELKREEAAQRDHLQAQIQIAQAEADVMKQQHGEGSKEYEAAMQHVDDLQRQAVDQSYAMTVDFLKREEAAYQHNLAAKISIATQEAAVLKEQHGAESKEYQASLEHITDLQRQQTEQMKQIAEIQTKEALQGSEALIDQQEKQAEFLAKIGQISQQQLLKSKISFLDQRYQLELADINRRIGLATQDPDLNQEQVAQLQAQKNALTRQYGAQNIEIQHQLASQQLQIWDTVANSMNSLFDKGLKAMLSHTLTWRSAMKGILQEVQTTFVQLVEEQVKKWIVGEAVKTAVTKAGALIRSLFEQQASTQTMGTKIKEASTVIGANAGEAASGAASSQASIPYAGPALAAAAFAAIMAMVLGAKSALKSASKGYDVPRGMNPVTQLHSEEMVLPEKHANVIRSMADNGNGNGGGDHYHLHVHAMDSNDVQRYFTQNSHVLGPAIQSAMRNGQIKYR